MSQNVYDDPAFFAGYSSLPRSVKGLAAAPEWPALKAYLPPPAGLRVLDLGCGFGYFARWARDAGAAEVLAVDVSEKMLAWAREMTTGEGVRYERVDLDGGELEGGGAGFDVVFSSLALHYLVRLRELAGEVHRVLRQGGTFAFSIEHPVYTAPSRPEFVSEADGRVYWPLDGYQREGERVNDWLGGRVVKQHRTLTTYINVFLEAGFEVRGFNEWYPTPEEIEEHGWGEVLERPIFLLMSVVKK